MARWMSKETKTKLKRLLKEGLSQQTIMNRLGITDGQFRYQCVAMGLRPPKIEWGLARVYQKLQGGRK